MFDSEESYFFFKKKKLIKLQGREWQKQGLGKVIGDNPTKSPE